MSKPKEQVNPRWQRQKEVSTYLWQLETLEIQLAGYAQIPDEMLDQLKWEPHPVWNWPVFKGDPKGWQVIWERWAIMQQLPYRQLIPGVTPETPVTDAMKAPVVIEDHDPGPTPPDVNQPEPTEPVGGAIILQSDDERDTAIATGEAMERIGKHRKAIVRGY